MRSTTSFRYGAMLAVIIVAIVLAACASAGSAPVGASGAAGAPRDEGNGVVTGPIPGASAGGGDAQGGGQEEPPGEAAPIEQRIIKTGEVGIEVDNVAGMLARVRAMAVELGGYVGGSQAGTLEQSATITLRVPAARFDELLSRLHELEDSKVISESTREQDVTRDVVDLEARIRNLQASEASYRTLLERAEKIEDILTVQSRLDEVRGQIEQLQGQLQTVVGQADLSTLTATLVPRSEPVEEVQAGWDPGAQLKSAIATLVGMGQGILEALIWFAVVWVPVLLLIGLIGVIVLRGALEVRRRLPPPAGEPPRSA